MGVCPCGCVVVCVCACVHVCMPCMCGRVATSSSLTTLSPLPQCLCSDKIDKLSEDEAALAVSLENEGAVNPVVLHVLNALSRRIRPAQLTIHRRLLRDHLDSLSSVIDDVSNAALKTTRETVADAAAKGLSAGVARATQRAMGK